MRLVLICNNFEGKYISFLRLLQSESYYEISFCESKAWLGDGEFQGIAI